MSHHVRIGLIGCGNIGGAFAELLLRKRPEIMRTTGVDVELARIAVKDLDKPRPAGLDPALFTTDTHEVVTADDIDIVVELIGGVAMVREYLISAMKAQKSVVSANKELVAAHSEELFRLASESGVDLYFEAAVMAAVPVLRVLRESLVGEDVRRITGIVNGTANYMLSRMASERIDYDEALHTAQELGYAEPDPTADVTGADSASKLAILASLAFRRSVRPTDIETEGILGLTAEDFETAARFGYAIKLVAVAEAFGDPGTEDLEVGVQVFPALIDVSHPLAKISGTTNAVSLLGLASDELIFSGPGAGQLPTAAAILGDVITAADHLGHEIHRPLLVGSRARVRPTAELVHAFYLRVRVVDAPGVLSEVAGLLGRHGVSIKSLTQEGRGEDATIGFITHAAAEGSVRAAITEFGQLPSVHGQPRVTRILDLTAG